MRRFLLSILFFVFACANAWGESWISGGTTITYSDGKLTVTKNGNGQMDNYDNTLNTNWGVYKSSVTTLVVEEGITHIGAYCFDGFNKITSVKIPSTVTTIGNKAFNGCSKITKVYASTPNDWASIVFQGSTPSLTHPFGSSSVAKRNFYFYGKTAASDSTKYLAFKAGITTIQPYAFYKATGISEVYIPGTVTTIGDYAFYCNIKSCVVVNNQTPPATSTHSFSFKNDEYSSNKYTRLYVPQGSEVGYSSNPWYNGTSSTNNAPGAHYIGRKGDANRCADQGYNISGTGYVYPTEGDIDNIHWTLNTQGELLLEGHGTISSAVSTSTGQSDVLPWYFFKNLVNKVIIRPNGEDVSGLNNIIQYCYAIDSIIIEQNTIPTGTYSVTDDFRKTTDKVKLLVKANTTSINAANASATWNVDRIQIGLNEAAVYAEDQDNSALVTALGSLDLNFNLQLGRSLTNTQYNTFCSPIDLTKEQLNNADIRALESSSLDGEDLTLTFSEPREGIEAGKPYLVRPTTETLSNPTFENIAPSSLVSTTENTVTTYVDFIGVLAPTPLTGSDKNTLFLGAGNELFWPEANGNIGGMRAYFSVKEAAQKNGIRARIVMNKEVATGIQNTEHRIQTQKVLRNGQIIIIRDGKEYNVMGIMMK